MIDLKNLDQLAETQPRIVDECFELIIHFRGTDYLIRLLLPNRYPNLSIFAFKIILKLFR